LRALRDRFPPARISTACCQVQGAGAPAAIIDSLARLDELAEVEVIIVSRGGGKPRDLMAFDDEGVCRAIRAVSTPVVAAIGHTDDGPVCNHVTHFAHTPSRVAELVVPDRTVLLAELDEARAAQERAVRAFRARVEAFELRAAALRGSPLVEAWQRRVGEAGRVIDSRAAAFLSEVSSELARAREQIAAALPRGRADVAAHDRGLAEFAAVAGAAARRPAELRGEVDDLGERLGAAVRRVMRAEKTDYQRALDRLRKDLFTASRQSIRRSKSELARDGEELSAAGRRCLRGLEREVRSQAEILKASDYRDRGWLLASSPDGRTITSVEEVAVGDRLKLHMRDGEVGARAEDINVNDKE
jgi:exonuclease VII large subunit